MSSNELDYGIILSICAMFSAMPFASYCSECLLFRLAYGFRELAQAGLTLLLHRNLINHDHKHVQNRRRRQSLLAQKSAARGGTSEIFTLFLEHELS
jgi:hypothetical protein